MSNVSFCKLASSSSMFQNDSERKLSGKVKIQRAGNVKDREAAMWCGTIWYEACKIYAFVPMIISRRCCEFIQVFVSKSVFNWKDEVNERKRRIDRVEEKRSIARSLFIYFQLKLYNVLWNESKFLVNTPVNPFHT